MLGMVILLARWGGIWPFNQVVLKIHNVGSIDYEYCTVHITGRTYDLGTLPSDSTRSSRLSPEGESQIELNLKEHDGSQHHLVVDCYFESHGYSGTITVEVGDGEILKVTDNIGIGFP